MANPLTNIPVEGLEHEGSSVIREAETLDDTGDSNRDLYQASNVDAHDVNQGGQENGDRAQPLPWTGVHPPEAPVKIINRRKKKDPMAPKRPLSA